MYLSWWCHLGADSQQAAHWWCKRAGGCDSPSLLLWWCPGTAEAPSSDSPSSPGWKTHPEDPVWTMRQKNAKHLLTCWSTLQWPYYMNFCFIWLCLTWSLCCHLTSASPGSFDSNDSSHKTTRRNKCETSEKELRGKSRGNVWGSTLRSRSGKDVRKMTASTKLLVFLRSM